MPISASSWCLLLLLLLLCLPLLLAAQRRTLCVCPGCNQRNVDRRCRCCVRADTKRSVPDYPHYSEKAAGRTPPGVSMSSQRMSSPNDSITYTRGISLPRNNASHFVIADGKPSARHEDNLDENVFRDINKTSVTFRPT